MAGKLEPISKIDFKDKAEDIDVDAPWDEAKKWLAKVGQSTGSAPDAKKIRAAMAKAKKAAVYVAVLDGSWLTLRVQVGTTVIEELTSADLSGGGNQRQWRAGLEALRKASKLVTDADLKVFDAKHPDPERVNELKTQSHTLEKELRVIDFQIKRLQDARTPKADEFQRVQKAIRALGG